MIKRELESNKRYTDTMVKSYIQVRDSLEKTEEVKCYLETLENLKKEQEFQKFLNQLEVGEDGTVFSPYEEYQDRALKNTHFGLARSLNLAIELISKAENCDMDSEFYVLSFERFKLYLDNAREILTDMNYVDGDRLFDNEYDYVIHQNPRNYSVVDFQSVLPLTRSILEQNYDMFHVFVTLDACFAIEKAEYVFWDRAKYFTPREREAFCGKKAQEILGLIPKKERVRAKK